MREYVEKAVGVGRKNRGGNVEGRVVGAMGALRAYAYILDNLNLQLPSSPPLSKPKPDISLRSQPKKTKGPFIKNSFPDSSEARRKAPCAEKETSLPPSLRAFLALSSPCFDKKNNCFVFFSPPPPETARGRPHDGQLGD